MLSPELKEELSHRRICTIIRNGYITAENKLEVIELFLLNRSIGFFMKFYDNGFFTMEDIVNAIIKNPILIQKIPNNFIKDDNFINLILEVLQPEWYDFLPPSIACIPEVQKKCDRVGRSQRLYEQQGIRDKDGYDKNWVNENGELKIFFTLKNNFPIKSKDDYIVIYKKYLKSNLSVKAFCEKYGISPIKGFEELLTRLKLEDKEDFEKINDLKKKVSNSFYNFSRDTAKKIANGEITLEDFFNNTVIDFSITNVYLFYNAMSLEDRNKFSRKIIDYYDKHLNLVPNNFIKFLTVYNLNPIGSYNTFVKKNLQMPKDKKYIYSFHRQVNFLIQQSKPYSRKGLYVKYIVDGKDYIVDDSIIDQAYAYATDNSYHISEISMRYLTKQIALGLINYSKETKEQREEMIETILNLLDEKARIEDYIAIMDKYSKRK